VTLTIPGLLADTQALFAASGWDLDDFDFRMEGDGAAAPAADGAGAPPADPPAAPPAADGGESDPFDNPAADSFPRAYVEKLRQEAAERRTALKKYEDTFSPYSEPERDVWNQLISITAQDPAKGAEMMLDLHHRLMGTGDYADEGPDPTATLGDGKSKLDDDLDKPMTKKELEEYLQEQARKADEETRVKAVTDEAVSLGYKPGTHQYVALLRRALDDHNGDLKAAHAAFEADKQKVIDEFIAQQAALGNSYPKLSGAGGAPPADPTGGAPKDFKAAKASLQARLANLG
jgi:hypothetical protein